ncbi:MAG: TIGR02452 family protein, partial [Micromonosporaceae bacterium]|nr:TIGR02452 family protein [Micromonosporaceae bacterium]
RLYLPDDELPEADEPLKPLVVEVTRESTLAAGRRLGPGTAALVFASARNPGGGFLSGAKAQEEDVARASALYECLITVDDYYAYHRAHRDLRYTDRVIYCPDVPVFRGDDGTLLEEPYGLSFIVAAAPNLGAILTNQPELAGTVPAVLKRRAERVLRVAMAHGHRQIVLGAWGCGVFRNPPEIVAEAFRHALTQVPGFERVVFAILDRTGDSPTFSAFNAAVASWPRAGAGPRAGAWTRAGRGPALRFWACPSSGPWPGRAVA